MSEVTAQVPIRHDLQPVPGGTLPRSTARVPQAASAAVVVQLFGGPRIVDRGLPLEVPEGSKRLLVLVALSEGRVERRKAAGLLWPDVDEARAAGNLRSAHWRLRGACIDALSSDGRTLSFIPGTIVDVDAWCGWALRVIEGRTTAADLHLEALPRDALDLLPGWYDDWVIFERERVRQRLLHALEALSRALSARNRHAEAIEAAMAVVAADPLRDSAHRALIEAHLGEGNVVEARRAFVACRETFHDELGIEPSPALSACLRDAERAVTLLRPHAVGR